MLLIGSHVSMNGKEMMVGSVKEALSYGANCLMVYTGAPQNTRRKPTDELMIKEAQELMIENGLELKNVIVHAPYIMNLANMDPEKRQFAVDFLTEEIKRTHAMGAKQIVLHPGAHVKQGPEVGIAHIIEGLNKVIENTIDLDVLIALETMAGKGTECGRSFEELRTIIDGVEHDERISVCFDTCHTHDAGYDTKDDFDKRFANIIFIHYDSPFADRDFLEKVKRADTNKTSLFVIDESQRFINNVYNNISSKKGKRAQVIYDYIQQEKKDQNDFVVE